MSVPLRCPELLNLPRVDNEPSTEMVGRIDQAQAALVKEIAIEDYYGLPRPAYDIIRQWYENATQGQTTYEPENEFSRFINAWISFNCWAMTVTGQPDQERHMLAIVTAWPRLNDRFDGFQCDNADVAAFAQAWPIMNMREARLLYKGRDKKRAEFRKDLSKDGWETYESLYGLMTQCRDVDMDGVRRDLFALLRRKGVLSKYARLWSPACFVHHRSWLSHPNEEPDIPTDWPHVLNAIYQVRCNLFHGDKSARVRRDQEVVVPASRVLIGFLNSTGYPNY